MNRSLEPSLALARTITSEVLFIDLDGTLVRTHMLWEGIAAACKIAPVKLLLTVLSLTSGRAHFNQQLAKFVTPDFASLPYDAEVILLATEARAQGTKVVLTAETDIKWATLIAEHLDLFDHVISSDGDTHCTGRARLAQIQSHCHDHGFDRFAYIGDANNDIPIWREASEPVVVRPARNLIDTIKDGHFKTIGNPESRITAAIKLIRVKQWAKNLLVFAPLVFGHAVNIPSAWYASILAFIIFSLVASSVYIVNDFLDVSSDRLHASKFKRPLACGSVPLSWAPILATVLFATGFALSLLLPPVMRWTLAGYFALSTTYSIWLKGKPLIDVLVLAGLYTIRIIAGGAATGIVVSDWLLAFSVFLFNSLAFVKRYTELGRLGDNGHQTTPGRGYHVDDLSLVRSLGTCSGYMAVVVFALYIRGQTAVEMYPNSWALWLICPLLLYWISYVWLKAHRRQLDDDPVIFALRDKTSLTVGTITLLLAIIAAMPKVFTGSPIFFAQ